MSQKRMGKALFIRAQGVHEAQSSAYS